MSYSVIPIEKFKKEVKRLVKKYPSLKKELSELLRMAGGNTGHGGLQHGKQKSHF